MAAGGTPKSSAAPANKLSPGERIRLLETLTSAEVVDQTLLLGPLAWLATARFFDVENRADCGPAHDDGLRLVRDTFNCKTDSKDCVGTFCPSGSLEPKHALIDSALDCLFYAA